MHARACVFTCASVCVLGEQCCTELSRTVSAHHRGAHAHTTDFIFLILCCSLFCTRSMVQKSPSMSAIPSLPLCPSVHIFFAPPFFSTSLHRSRMSLAHTHTFFHARAGAQVQAEGPLGRTPFRSPMPPSLPDSRFCLVMPSFR